MKITRRKLVRLAVMFSAAVILTGVSSRLKADTGTCSSQMITLPFTDVMSSPFFCQIAEAYFSGLTNGTTGTTYSPGNNVTREQMAAFVTRTMDQSLRRGSRRAATDQWFTPQTAVDRGILPMTLPNHAPGSRPLLIKSDGQDLFVASNGTNEVFQIQSSNGHVIQVFGPVEQARAVLVANGFIYAVGDTSPGNLYYIKTSANTAIHLISNSLGDAPTGIACDGQKIWTANYGGSVSIVTLDGIGDSVASVHTVSTGFTNPIGIVFDGSSIWITDDAGKLMRLNSNGTIAQSIDVGSGARFPIFDGTNIWVPSYIANTVTVVRVRDSSGNPLASAFVLATLTGNGLNGPHSAAFDGERILITNYSGNSVSLWKASDLTAIGTVPTGYNHNGVFESAPYGACSDGLNFFITLYDSNAIVRF